MNILIPSNYGYDFVLNLLKRFRSDIEIKIETTDFTVTDAWLELEFKLPKNVTSRKIISYALDNIVIIKFDTHYKMMINENINYLGTSTRLITLVRAITFGNTFIKGIPIIADEFKWMNNNLKRLYEDYRFVGVLV